MTPKEKAEELFRKYTIATWIKLDEIKHLTTIPTAKESALIAVDELINECTKFFEAISKDRLTYWQEVKKQIENL